VAAGEVHGGTRVKQVVNVGFGEIEEKQ
jgi:hypothetical protein